jgi:hypothetical protein
MFLPWFFVDGGCAVGRQADSVGFRGTLSKPVAVQRNKNCHPRKNP